jgi:hypothetical protein
MTLLLGDSANFKVASIPLSFKILVSVMLLKFGLPQLYPQRQYALFLLLDVLFLNEIHIQVLLALG